MTDDYEVIIEDLEIGDVILDVTKNELIEILNKKLSRGWTAGEREDGLDIPVESEWENILKEDGSILYEYTKLGWKVSHMQQKKQDGSIRRQWLSFKNLNYKRGK